MVMAALEDGGWSNVRHLEVIPTAVSAERELQKIRGKLVAASTSGSPTSLSGQPQRPDMDLPSTAGQWQQEVGYKLNVATKEQRSEE